MHFNYLEMKYLVFCVTLNFLFFANFVSSTVTIVAKYDDKTTNTKKYEIKQALQLSCNVTTDGLVENQKVEVTWEKDGKLVTEIDQLKKRLSLSHNGNKYKLQINSAEENDGGNYSCVASINGVEETRAFITVESKIYVKIPRDITVVEGEKLRVVCQVHGNPTPQIVWVYKNVTYEESKGRVKLEEEKNVPNAVFTLEDVTPDDQSELTCKGISKNTNESSDPSMGVVRVKDKYAALWPFLGICAEVLVLCAIILIYEKKRNKTELEESDTDQSPEQKNTPDHGGKESNLRHRQ
ncbi:hypothetical protein ILUMI_12619 [Ignelater luminosus]|uniref:Ig-like domain-containing protein n=1 Tax=Ignelater luminosus TaxID=2038154 RepID=A0A8K0GC55_IGNLU|nr:hypothetical protein ILUMI_12619 [Ignelater luminosus]